MWGGGLTVMGWGAHSYGVGDSWLWDGGLTVMGWRADVYGMGGSWLWVGRFTVMGWGAHSYGMGGSQFWGGGSQLWDGGLTVMGWGAHSYGVGAHSYGVGAHGYGAGGSRLWGSRQGLGAPLRGSAHLGVEEHSQHHVADAAPQAHGGRGLGAAPHVPRPPAEHRLHLLRGVAHPYGVAGFWGDVGGILQECRRPRRPASLGWQGGGCGGCGGLGGTGLLDWGL